jgi:hypothetical protein
MTCSGQGEEDEMASRTENTAKTKRQMGGNVELDLGETDGGGVQ